MPRTSMRWLIVLTVAAVVFVPLTTVLVLGVLSGSARERLSARLLDLAQRAPVDDDDALRSFAAREHVGLRVYDAGGRVLFVASEAPHRRNLLGVASAGATMVEPDVAPPLDEHLLSSMAPEQIECVPGELMERCQATALRDGHIVVVEAHAARGIVRLLDEGSTWARPLTVLALGGLVLGFVFALLLMRRSITPLARLGAEVQTRTGAVIETKAIELDAPSEIAALVDAFNRLLVALDDERKRTDHLLQDLAHELKTPLATLRTSLVLLDGDASALGSAESATRRIDATIMQLLEVSRAAAGEFQEETQRVRFDQVVDAQLDAWADELDEAGRTLRIERHLDEVAIDAASRACGRAIRCLLDNAAHFAMGEVKVTLRRENDVCLLSVIDDGPGIDEGDVDTVFERFVTRRSGGTGIGLALVRAVARAHGGDAFADPGPGGAVHLRWPMSAGTPE